MADDIGNTLVLTLDAGEGKGGDVVIKLRPDLAPGHVARIKELVGEGFYDGVIFHRGSPIRRTASSSSASTTRASSTISTPSGAR